jgi:hypothetical protein
LVKDFYYIARYQMAVPGTERATGAIIMPSGIASHTLSRRTMKGPAAQRRLLDPQVYLGDLQPDRCRKACSYLASYPWFLTDGIAKYDSAVQTQKQWKVTTQASIAARWRGVATSTKDIETVTEACVAFQIALGVEAILLPSPLIRDHASDYSREMEWLEIGLAAAHRLAPGLPRLATIAISDTCLRGFRPEDNTLLDLILDQVTARTPEGAYLVLEQANETTYNCTSENTVGALLRLTEGLKAGGLRRVIVCYAGVAGLLTLLVGADAWATGWYRGERRLRLVDFEQLEGRAMPAYYSHPTATEFHLANDLGRVRDRGFLDAIRDETPASEPLLRALAAGQNPQNVPAWAPTQGNVKAARTHFATAMIRETARVAMLDEAGALVYGRKWTQLAASTAASLYGVGSFNPRTELDHQRAWRDAFERAVAAL